VTAYPGIEPREATRKAESRTLDGAYHDLESRRTDAAKFVWSTTIARPALFAEQRWLASVWRRTGK
jgi:hypothetical protein